MEFLYPIKLPAGSIVAVFITFLICISCEKSEEEPNTQFTQYKWEVESIIQPGGSEPLDAPAQYIIEFITDSTYKISLDVNHCEGDYSIPEAGRIEFYRGACTEICCDSDYANNLPGLFATSTSYSVNRRQLILEGEGQITLKRISDK